VGRVTQPPTHQMAQVAAKITDDLVVLLAF